MDDIETIKRLEAEISILYDIEEIFRVRYLFELSWKFKYKYFEIGVSRAGGSYKIKVTSRKFGADENKSRLFDSLIEVENYYFGNRIEEEELI